MMATFGTFWEEIFQGVPVAIAVNALMWVAAKVAPRSWYHVWLVSRVLLAFYAVTAALAMAYCVIALPEGWTAPFSPRETNWFIDQIYIPTMYGFMLLVFGGVLAPHGPTWANLVGSVTISSALVYATYATVANANEGPGVEHPDWVIACIYAICVLVVLLALFFLSLPWINSHEPARYRKQ